MESVTVMICTYKRLIQLKNTLISITKLDYDLSKINIIIVDNESNINVKNMILDFKNYLNVNYYEENRRGISYARNKCLDIALAIDSDYVAFIDDDEIVSKEWLKELVNTMKKFGGDIARGPVKRIYPLNVPKWVIKSKIYENNILNNGEEIDICFTGNVLLKKSIIGDLRFDERYALSGGEDTKFFMYLRKCGRKIVYAKNAVVFEELSNERMKIKYIIKRAFRDANNYRLIENELYGKKFLVNFCKDLIKISLNLIKIPLIIFGGYELLVSIFLNFIRCFGDIYALFIEKNIQGY